jgi:cyclopropane fatty-acyl-phospholipid synthase-like methyltransferase
MTTSIDRVLQPAVSDQEVEHDAGGIQFHYDLPAAFFELELGPTLSYSSAYFRDPAKETLDEAQLNKLAIFCKKLELGPDDHLLDLGAGWGNLMFYAAKNFGCKVTGVSLSPEQKKYVEERAEREGLSHLIQYDIVHVHAMNYPPGTFTKAGSLEATEHMANLKGLYQRVLHMMKDNGLINIQVITKRFQEDDSRREEDEGTKFIRKHIYPVGDWVTLSGAVVAIEEAGFEIVDVESLTDHYTVTHRRWLENLMKAYDTKAAETGVAPDRYLAQVFFAAGSVDEYERNAHFDYQILARKIGAGRRIPLPFDRSGLLLDGPERKTVAPPPPAGKVVLEVLNDDTKQPEIIWNADMVSGEFGMGYVDNPVCTLTVGMSDAMKLLSGELSWPDAFVYGRLTHKGDLTAALWLRDIRANLNL